MYWLFCTAGFWFLAMICFWVMNWEADIKTTITPAMICTWMVVAVKKVSESLAPNRVASENWIASSELIGPTPDLRAWAPFRVKKRPMKIGIWTKIGRHEESGFEPVLLYRSICSLANFSLDSRSFLPLYFF